jgi:hypothetical protein
MQRLSSDPVGWQGGCGSSDQYSVRDMEVRMPGKKQIVQLGDSAEHIERVVDHRRARMTLGIETGCVQYRLGEIAVWRPMNPHALGLDLSWSDGIWRNIYGLKLARVGGSRLDREANADFEVDGVPFSLPRVEIEVSPALSRFLKQHLR